MGDMTRQALCEAFINEFEDDIVASMGLKADWVKRQYLDIDESDMSVRLVALVVERDGNERSVAVGGPSTRVFCPEWDDLGDVDDVVADLDVLEAIATSIGLAEDDDEGFEKLKGRYRTALATVRAPTNGDST
jgi:hypothetical protein